MLQQLFNAVLVACVSAHGSAQIGKSHEKKANTLNWLDTGFQAQHQLQPTQQEDLELPEDMELDEGPGEQEGQEEVARDEADEEADGKDGQGDATESAPQPFPEQPVTEGPEPELADGASSQCTSVGSMQPRSSLYEWPRASLLYCTPPHSEGCKLIYSDSDNLFLIHHYHIT